MSYMLRDRPDGQFEIVLTRPMMVGIFAERDTASKFMLFLQEDEDQIFEEEPASFGQAQKDVAEMVADLRSDKDIAPAALVRVNPPEVRGKPAAISPENDLALAFARIAAGEKIGDIAPEYGMTLNKLRGLWAAYCRKPKVTAFSPIAGGQVPCGRDFTPSMAVHDICARCSRD